MCGLVGLMSSNFLGKHQECLSNLLYLDTWRGWDSTGVAAIRHNADTDVLKQTVPGCEFVQGPKLKNFLRLNDFLWIGHNRHGTVGRNIKTNAHPFIIEDADGGAIVVGAHNGTLKNKYVLKDDQHFGTDSEALFNEIAWTNVKDTIAKVEGAWALTYYDHIVEEFRVLRNKERTLYYAWEKDRKTLIWASEQWMITIATSRAGIELEEIDGIKTHAFAEDTLYKFPAPMKLNDVLSFTTEEGLAGKAEAFFQQGQTWRNWKQEAQKERETTGGISIAKSTLTTTTSTSGTNVVPLGLPLLPNNESKSKKQSEGAGFGGSRLHKGYGSEMLTEQELKKVLKDGCSWCELEEIEIGDRFAWLEPGKPVCHKCLQGVPELSETEVTMTAQTVH